MLVASTVHSVDISTCIDLVVQFCSTILASWYIKQQVCTHQMTEYASGVKAFVALLFFYLHAHTFAFGRHADPNAWYMIGEAAVYWYLVGWLNAAALQVAIPIMSMHSHVFQQVFLFTLLHLARYYENSAHVLERKQPHRYVRIHPQLFSVHIMSVPYFQACSC